MKKALEAGIKYIKDEYTLGCHSMDAGDLLDVLREMLSALYEPEPEKKEVQGSVVDAEALETIYGAWCNLACGTKNYVDLSEFLIARQSQWLKTKPAIDPEIKMVYEKWVGQHSLGTSGELNRSGDCWEAIKAYVEKG